MIEPKILLSSEYNHYAETISLLNRMVFEELYRDLHNYEFEQAPYEYYHADHVISPRDTKNHSEYFGYVKPLAIELFDNWYSKLVSVVARDDRDIKSLTWIGHNIKHAKDMVELVWYSMQLQYAVWEYSRIQKGAI
jgi:hypothetical protein